MSVKLHRAGCLTVAAAVFLVAGCGKGDKASTQVAAKVNKDEISVHQINYLLSRAGQIPPEQLKPASRQALERLIDQELMVQQAMEAKLDRDPGVMQTLDNNRRQVLAQAYLERVTSAAARPSSIEISDYYSKHPELFGQRRIYRFQQLSIAGGKDVAADVQQKLSDGKTSMDNLAAWAKEKNLRYGANTVTKPAEQLPMELLPHLYTLKEGQTAVMTGPSGVSVIQLLAFQDQPIDEKTAAPVIEQFLLNKRKTDLAQNEVKKLRNGASIEYVGDFVPNQSEKPAPPPAASAAPAAVNNTVQATAASAKPTTQVTDSLSKGIEGLK